MPNYIKYSTDSQTLALKSGNFYIGTGDVNKGPTPSTGYWTARTPPASGYTVYQNINTTPSIYVCDNDSDLINLTNTIAGQSYTSVTECLVYYLGQNDKMCLNIPYPEIVTNGLVLNLDAGFVPSYPRTATTWYDLSGNGNNGTLINGPTYSSDNGGSIQFDGSNDVVQVSNSNSLNPSTNILICWAKSNTANWNAYGCLMSKRDVFIMHPNINEKTVDYFYRINNTWQSQLITVPNITIWNMYACSWNGSSISAYLNGQLINSGAKTGTLNTSDTGILEIGKDDTFARYLNGNISQVCIYNRALSATEVLQNYNATKSRFGL